jgi:TRAP transporter TAXI family solute receptor
LAEKANLDFDGHPITAVPGAGGVSNPVRVSMTGMDLGISYGPFIRGAYRGEAPFREAYPQLRLVAKLIVNTLHIFARPELKLETASDLLSLDRGVKVGGGLPGSGELFCLRAILEAHGTNLEEWDADGPVLRLAATSQRFNEWKDGRLEVGMTFVNDPSPSLTELMFTRPGRFLPVPDELSQTLRQRWGFVDIIVPAGAYPNQDYMVRTVGLPCILFTVDGVDEEIVYAATKALYENQDYMRKVHPGFKHWEPQDIPTEVEVPFHPGAIRYYREQELKIDHSLF